MTNQITLTIDGTEVQARPGTTVLEAATQAGIYIPYLCYHPGMKPFAACRMCLVEVQGARGLPASCAQPVAQGMVVQTTTEELLRLRRSVTEMLISEHPHGCLTCHRIDLCGPQDICQRHVSVNGRCVTCPKNERCELKDTTRFLGVEMESPLSYAYRTLPIETKDPFYDRDYNLCIVCGRCVRACEELRGDSAITFTHRAGQALVGTSRGTSLLESGCEFCGACIDVCPVGALVERDHKWDKAARVERTVCPHCPVGCQLNLEINRQGRVIRAIPELSAPSNRGQACFKGKFGLDYVNSGQRVRHPLIQRNGQLQQATWEEALELLAERLPQYIGPPFAAIASAQGTNEAAYVLQKFTRLVMGSNNVEVDSNTRPALTRALLTSLGYASATNPIWDLENAACILVVDANVTEEHNVVGVPVKRATRKGAKLIVVDCREVELTRYAHLWLRPRPGTTTALLGGMLRVILEEGLEDAPFVEQRCAGMGTLRPSLEAFSLPRVSQMTGVPTEAIQQAARLYAAASPAAILYALDNVALEQQEGCVRALTDLAMLTGNLGKPSAGLYPLRHGANEQGAQDVGCVPDLLPGYHPLQGETSRRRVQEAWGARVPLQAGAGLYGILQGAREGSIRAALLLGDSPNYANGELGNGYEALDSLELLVVQDAFLGPAAQRAHVVLPATTFVEEEGTYTNLERRVQRLPHILAPRNIEARPAWLFLCQLAKALDARGFDFTTPAEVFQEIAQLVEPYQGISHERLAREVTVTLRPDTANPLPTQLLYSDRVPRGIQWPCPTARSRETARLYTDAFPMERAGLLSLESSQEPSHNNPDYPFLFVPGRVLAQPHREMTVVEGERLNRIQRAELLEVHPLDAADLGIAMGDPVWVISPVERFLAFAHLTETAGRGVVAATFLFGELATRLEASEDPDPMSRVPGLRVVPVRLEKTPG